MKTERVRATTRLSTENDQYLDELKKYWGVKSKNKILNKILDELRKKGACDTRTLVLD